MMRRRTNPLARESGARRTVLRRRTRPGFVVAFTRSPRVAVAHVRSDHADLTALLTVPVYRAEIIHP
jgi:hypothetical protein